MQSCAELEKDLIGKRRCKRAHTSLGILGLLLRAHLEELGNTSLLIPWSILYTKLLSSHSSPYDFLHSTPVDRGQDMERQREFSWLYHLTRQHGMRNSRHQKSTYIGSICIRLEGLTVNP